MQRLARHALPAVLVLVAPVVAVCGAAVHLADLSLGPIRLPWGLLLALAGSTGLFVLAHLLATNRWWIGGVALGWLAPVVVLSMATGAGDLVLTQSAASWVYLIGGVVGIGVVLGLTPAGARQRGGVERATH